MSIEFEKTELSVKIIRDMRKIRSYKIIKEEIYITNW